MAPTSPDVPAARASRAAWRGRVIGQESLPNLDGGWRRRTIYPPTVDQRLRCPASTVRRDRRSTLANEANQREPKQSQIPGEQNSLRARMHLVGPNSATNSGRIPPLEALAAPGVRIHPRSTNESHSPWGPARNACAENTGMGAAVPPMDIHPPRTKRPNSLSN